MPDPVEFSLSIITVTRNNLKGLLCTAQSINEQTQRQAVQWVVIDGNSTDGTQTEIQKNLHNGDYFISENDQGLYDAMNKGLRAAKGEYVWFLNAADTLFAYNIIELLLPFLSNYDVVYGETMLCDTNGKKLGTRSEKTTRKLPAHLGFQSMLKGMVVNHQSIIVRKSVCPRFDLKWRIAADYDWLCTLLKSNPSTCNSKLIHSCFELGGLSSQKVKASWRERFIIMQKHFGSRKTFIAHLKIFMRAAKQGSI